MANQSFSLPKEDIRAQEMIFWLKKLSLDIPELVKPEVDLTSISIALEQNSHKTRLLEEQNFKMLQSMERLDRRLDECFDLLKDMTGHLSRLANPPVSTTSSYMVDRSFESSSSSNHPHTQKCDDLSGPLHTDPQGRSQVIPRSRSKRCISIQQTEDLDAVAEVADVSLNHLTPAIHDLSHCHSEQYVATRSDCLPTSKRLPRAAGTSRSQTKMLNRQAASLPTANSVSSSKRRSRRQLIVAPMSDFGVQDSQIQHSAEL